TPDSFVIVTDQKHFDKVFGVASVMRDKSHRLPRDAFKSLIVIARIKRGSTVVEYKVDDVTEGDDVVALRYTTAEKKSDTASYACPLIVSIPKGKYTAIQFVENGKEVKKVEMSAPFALSLDKAKVGELPEGWSAAKTGEGPGSVWKVLEDKNGKKVLAQISDQGPNRFFNLCVAENTSFTDIDLTAAFKAVAGKLDQGGGLVWRYKDADNYYIARMNPLEDNYRVYKVVAGKRAQLGSVDVKIPSGEWHTLRVVHKADHIQCYLDGKPYLDVKDDTFKDAGKIGFWTKADAQTYFANMQAKMPR
ncbi:MAG: family 16 glycoside hydrolase, partial [Thermoguttaceae bacterium]